MGIKKFRPTTPSLRQMRVQNSDGLTKDAKVEKSLLAPNKKLRVETFTDVLLLEVVVVELRSNTELSILKEKV